MKDERTARSWREINLNAIEHNIKEVQKHMVNRHHISLFFSFISVPIPFIFSYRSCWKRQFLSLLIWSLYI